MDSAAIFAEIAAIKDYIETAERTIESGVIPDMLALQPRIANLCAELMKAPEQTQKEALAMLPDILERLDTCEAALMAHRMGTGGKEKPPTE